MATARPPSPSASLAPPTPPASADRQGLRSRTGFGHLLAVPNLAGFGGAAQQDQTLWLPGVRQRQRVEAGRFLAEAGTQRAGPNPSAWASSSSSPPSAECSVPAVEAVGVEQAESIRSSSGWRLRRIAITGAPVMRAADRLTSPWMASGSSPSRSRSCSSLRPIAEARSALPAASRTTRNRQGWRLCADGARPAARIRRTMSESGTAWAEERRTDCLPNDRLQPGRWLGHRNRSISFSQISSRALPSRLASGLPAPGRRAALRRIAP